MPAGPAGLQGDLPAQGLIVVEFTKENPDCTRGIEYPQRIRPDDQVSKALSDLRSNYPQVEFFTYDITKPGEAETSEYLGKGKYGTLAAQMKVGYTPFVAMLAPGGQGYVVENLF